MPPKKKIPYDNDVLSQKSRNKRKERAKKKIGELATSGKVSKKTIRSMDLSTEAHEAIEKARLEKGQIGFSYETKSPPKPKPDSTKTTSDAKKESKKVSQTFKKIGKSSKSKSKWWRS